MLFYRQNFGGDEAADGKQLLKKLIIYALEIFQRSKVVKFLV